MALTMNAPHGHASGREAFKSGQYGDRPLRLIVTRRCTSTVVAVTQRLHGENAEPLEGVDEARWEAVKAQGAALSQAIQDGSLDDDTLAGGLAALAQVPLDLPKVLNALHVPEDAGEHAAGLERMLRRIPDGWGRWVRCDAGWYELLVQLDEQIAALLPDYEIHQMKEKYGTLRFYWGLPELICECCEQRNQVDPRPLQEPVPAHLAPKGRTPEMQAVMDAWLSRQIAHLESEEHDACDKALRNGPVVARRSAAIPHVEALVTESQRRSAVTCERCSAKGSLRSRGYWVKTLCDMCAETLGYTEIIDDDD
jgi:hypothetical protein